ncbi:MAG: hypothetical protein CMM32_03445 [Rhodospirillaceae bacterium]|nr:hypothetical protein [Rhodospirillaceae bacterium]
MLVVLRNALLCWVASSIAFSVEGLGQHRPLSPEQFQSIFEEEFVLGQGGEWLETDLALKVFVGDGNVLWNDEWSTGDSVGLSELGSRIISIGPDAKFIVGNIMSLDMKIGYSMLSNRDLAISSRDQSGVPGSKSQWRWFSSVGLSSYHKVRGMNLHGRVNLSQHLVDKGRGLIENHNWFSEGYEKGPKQLIDARLGLALGRIEPFLGGLFSYKDISPISAFRKGWEFGVGASLGLRGGLEFEIGDALSGGIVGSRRLDSIGGDANALEGSLRIKF